MNSGWRTVRTAYSVQQLPYSVQRAAALWEKYQYSDKRQRNLRRAAVGSSCKKNREVYAAASAALALSASIVNVDGSTIAISERIFRSTSIPAFFSPFISPLYVIPF